MNLEKLHTFSISRSRALLMLAIFIWFYWLAVDGIFFGGFEGHRKEQSLRALSWLLFAMSPLIGAEIYRHVRCWRKPTIEISKNGFLDRRISKAPIPWGKVTKLEFALSTGRSTKTDWISLTLAPGTKKQAGVYWDKSMSCVLFTRSTDVVLINSASTHLDPDYFKHMVNAFWKEFKAN